MTKQKNAARIAIQTMTERVLFTNPADFISDIRLLKESSRRLSPRMLDTVINAAGTGLHRRANCYAILELVIVKATTPGQIADKNGCLETARRFIDSLEKASTPKPPAVA